MKIITHHFSAEQLAAAQAIAPDVEFVTPVTEEEMQREIEEADAIFAGVTPDLIRRAKKLRWIQTGGVGVEGLRFPELINSDIVLANARGTTAVNIAEHVMALILAFTRTLNITIQRQMEKVWGKPCEYAGA